VNWGKVLNFDAKEYAALREHAIFNCCKWDPQIEDRSALAPFALRIEEDLWEKLSEWAEGLAWEVVEMERIVLSRPEVLGELGIPRAGRGQLDKYRERERRDIRVMRFDFHCTNQGWRITEVNSDVPGGFIEAAGIGEFAGSTLGFRLPGNPAQRLAEVFHDGLGDGALVALVHASAYTDDFQVMEFLGRHFLAGGLVTILVAPDQISWRDGIPFCVNGRRIDGIYRFFPAEWLKNLPRATGWEHFFGGARAVLCNPATALISQNKRLPLLWERLGIACPLWNELLPETRDVREAEFDTDEWVLKPALGRVGEAVGWRGGVPEKEWRKIRFWAKWFPKSWVAQRRFESVPIETDAGRRHFCLGVYTVNGRAAGIYGRCSESPIINFRAQDVAVLLEHPNVRTKVNQERPAELTLR
jgi:glutathionylspermidine synthase